MIWTRRSIGFLLGIAVLVAWVTWPPIRQDPQYHAFADQRTLWGVSNFWNVISNAPFLLAAILGMVPIASRTAFRENWERLAYALVVSGTFAVGVGSAYYHLHPDDARLFWDRLPMTVVFMSLVAATVGERVSRRAGRALLLPLVALGLGSVIVWRVTGDLRLYVVLQFGAVLALALILAWSRVRSTQLWQGWATVILYLVAKVLEAFDHSLTHFAATGGHPGKHLAAALAIGLYLHSVVRRSGPWIANENAEVIYAIE